MCQLCKPDAFLEAVKTGKVPSTAEVHPVPGSRGGLGYSPKKLLKENTKLRWLLTPFPIVQSHSGMTGVALIHVLYKVTVVIHMTTNGREASPAFCDFCLQYRFHRVYSTSKFCPHPCAVKQLHCRNATQATRSRQGTSETCCGEEIWSFRPDRKRDGELMRWR